MEKDIPCKGKPKESRGKLYLRKTKQTKSKNCNEKQKTSLYNDKVVIHHENITIVNIYAPNIKAPKYINQIVIDLKGEMDNNTITVGDFSAPLSAMDKSSRQKINKKTLDLSYTVGQMDLTDI